MGNWQFAVMRRIDFSGKSPSALGNFPESTNLYEKDSLRGVAVSIYREKRSYSFLSRPYLVKVNRVNYKCRSLLAPKAERLDSDVLALGILLTRRRLRHLAKCELDLDRISRS